jgi:arylsulfatase A-like enzyme/Tfp pilus assembly protein PilF
MRTGPTQQRPSGASRSSRRGARASRPGAQQPWPGARPSRRALYLAAALLALVAVALVWLNRGAPADLAPISGQNVLLITIDTLRADALGASGGRSATPALDRVAQTGVRFDFAHAHAVVTLPSHASILTGRYPFQHGIRDNSGYRLPPDTTTIATILKKAGYATAAFVAAFPLHSRYGLNRGFDVYDDRFGETRAPTEFVMPERPASTVVPLARGWLANRRVDRWFMWVHVFDPHAPYAPPSPFDTQYAGRPYYGEVAATDAALAPLLDDVARSERPTLVVITSDHGEALGDHGEATHGLFAYESTLRVPLIIAEFGGRLKSDSVPGTVRLPFFGSVRLQPDQGKVSQAAARHVDLLPTILDAVGEPVPADLPGRTLLPDAERSGSAPRPSYFEAMSAMLNRGWAPLAGAIVNRDKYIDLPIPERYDLSADARETSNVAGREPERDRTLAAGLRAFGASLPGQRRTEEPETAARLRALGYVTGNAPVKVRYTEADDPKNLAPLDQAIHRGVSLYSERRYAEAAQLYEDIIKRRPDMALAYRHRAFVAWQTGKVGEAIGVLRQAIRNGITHGEVTTQLGTYLAESANPAEAIRLLEPALQAAEPDLDALNGLGIALARAGRSDEARRTFERMLALNSESGMALANLGALDLDRGQLETARARFEQAATLDPASSHAQAGLGIVAMKSGDRRRAIEAWTRAVQLDPTNYDALYNLATALARDGQMDAARPYLEQFVRTAPPAFYAKDIREIAGLLQKRAQRKN